MNTRHTHTHGCAPWIGVLALACAGSAAAGPNAGGVLILHVNPAIAYCTDDVTYCGQSDLTACDAAITSVTGGDPVVFFAIAAFGPSSAPRLSGVTFGVHYQSPNVSLLDWGSCGDFELATSGWPASDEGTAVTWNSARTGSLTEVYWFAGYNYYAPQPTLFGLAAHPTQGGVFADDSVPAQLDQIEGFGALGFEMPGVIPCGSDTPVGACCFQNPCGTCVVLNADECAAEGGTYQGDITSCEPNPCDCPPIFGACCFNDCQCAMLLQPDCLGNGGIYHGDNVTCDPSPCGAGPGACCLTDGTCVEAFTCWCAAMGGTYSGDGVLCSSDPCGPVATKSSTWGEIKGRYR
ncbi:MAG: hypothetical protein U0527_10625 [Candidatus Eisenbacteria bacterium]